MSAWAAGLNCYLEAHTQVRPRVITRFEPWMPLSFSEGSIGGDIEYVVLSQLEAFYDGKALAMATSDRVTKTSAAETLFREPQGSNGFAIAPSHTRNSRAAAHQSAHQFVSSRCGSLASFGAKRYAGTKRCYGTTGNSFLAAVEFGPTVRARAVRIGGASGHPESEHFADQVERYAECDPRLVYFYPENVKSHAERTYRPGETVPGR